MEHAQLNTKTHIHSEQEENEVFLGYYGIGTFSAMAYETKRTGKARSCGIGCTAYPVFVSANEEAVSPWTDTGIPMNLVS